MSRFRNFARKGRRSLLLWLLLSYALLLVMSYGFPVTGDDWFFAPALGRDYSLGEKLEEAVQTAAHHYETTNGRLLGNFLVKLFSFSKVWRELFRCFIILAILLLTYRLSGNEGLASYLACFALLIAMPARIVSQTYTWAAGFFNYVPPTLLVLLYVRFTQGVFCGDRRRSSPGWAAGMLLLGLSTQFFMENLSIGMCVLSAGMLIADWIRSKRPNLALLAHFAGAAVGCTVMLLAPGYRNVGVEGYREIPSGLQAILDTAKVNFKILSSLLTVDNRLVIIPLCLCGIAVCGRTLAERPGSRRFPITLCLLYYAAFPLLCFGLQTFGRYYFLIDFTVNLLLFLDLILTAVFCVPDRPARFVLLTAAGIFLIFICPLLAVTPVGARNAYFFDVLLILITMTLLRQAIRSHKLLPGAAPALILAACLLLCGNLWIHLRNGAAEGLRNQIVSEAMERGEREITLPGYPYPDYIHGAGSVGALSSHYYYDVYGDISFRFVTYRQWIESR